MEHKFFFYNKLKNPDMICKVHDDYTINEAFIIIDKLQYPSLVYNNSVIKDILDNNKIKIYGKYVTFNNITLDNIISNIIDLNIDSIKHTMFKIDNVRIISNNVVKNLCSKNNPWIII